MVGKITENATKAMFVDVLIEGTTPTAPMTQANADAWIKGLSVPFTTLFDADPASFTARTVYGIKETTYIVERATMKIVAKETSPEDGLATLATLPP